jgi:hypothetical protein
MAYPFEKMTTKKLNTYFAKQVDTNGKNKKQTRAARYKPEKKTETNPRIFSSNSRPGDSE